MKNKQIAKIVLSISTIIMVALVLSAYRFQPQKNMTSVTAAAANTACQATLSDFAGSTDATADLSCNDTGEITVAAWNQVTIRQIYTRSAGTVLNMQCDISIDNGTTWGPMMAETSAGVKTIRNWTTTTSVSGVITHNFEVNADKLRCRTWATSGDTGDLVGWQIRLASEVGER
jgi:hypothetical protein